MTDHFTSLPPELIQKIASYLYATHIPDKAYQTDSTSATFSRDLLNLALTSKVLHQQTSAWAHHHLHKHRTITKYKDFKTPSAAARQRPLRELLQWSRKNCVFCGKKSTRSAILMNGLRCCRACDLAQWTAKITKTEALKQFALTEHQLLPGQHHANRLLTLHPGLPVLRYGTYFSMGTLTTMFLRDDVEVLAELAKGDLTGHLKKRKKSREERETAAQELRALTAERHARRVAAGMEKAVVAARQGVSLRDVVVVADDEEVQVFEEYSRDEDLMFGEVAVVEDD